MLWATPEIELVTFKVTKPKTKQKKGKNQENDVYIIKKMKTYCVTQSQKFLTLWKLKEERHTITKTATIPTPTKHPLI